MKKNVLLVIGAIAATSLVVAGIAYAWSSKPSDVTAPTPTPDASIVKYHVIGSSMDPTINDGDWLLVDTKIGSIVPGEIIILRYPKDESTIYCRRVVAVAGDKVVMKYYSNVKITTVFSASDPNGVVFPQNALPNGNAYGEYDATVSAGNVYVVGDNTAPGGSFDSDEWGLLPLDDIVGLVTKRVSPDPRSF